MQAIRNLLGLTEEQKQQKQKAKEKRLQEAYHYYKYEFVSFISLEELETYTEKHDSSKKLTDEEKKALKENSNKYYELSFIQKVIFRILQLTGLHTKNPNQISMLAILALIILCYILTSVPSIFGYAIYPIMLFLTIPLLRHVSLVKWHTLFENEQALQISVLGPVLFGIALTIIGAIAKVIGGFSIPFLSGIILTATASSIILISAVYLIYSASHNWKYKSSPETKNKFDLMLFMAAATTLALALMTVLPIIAGGYASFISTLILASGLLTLATGLYSLYEEDTNKFWTLLCGLAIIASTIALTASLLNASFLFMLSASLTFEMIASSLTVGVLASIALYGLATTEVKQGLMVTSKDLKHEKCFGVNFNLEHISFWTMMKHAGNSLAAAGTWLASAAWCMLTGTFTRENIARVVNSAISMCSQAFNHASTAANNFSSDQTWTELDPNKDNNTGQSSDGKQSMGENNQDGFEFL